MFIGGRAHSFEEIKKVGKAELDFAEINLLSLNVHHTFQEISHLLKLRKEFGFFFVIHGPEEENPFDCHELRCALVPKVKMLIDVACELGANLITLHFWLDQRFISQTTLNGKFGILGEIVNEAVKKNITLCLENLSERCKDFETVFHHFPHLGLTLDIGHGELLSNQNTSYSFIETHPERIRHVHIHDNFGGNSPSDDLHLPLGAGTINFEPILQALCRTGYNSTITLETPPASLREGKKKLKRWLAPFTLT